MIREDALNIYTDGSSYSSPRTGGIGIRIITVNDSGDEVIEEHPMPGYQNATNNQMELYACIAGLQEVATHPRLALFQRICIFTDSRYVVDNYKNAMFSWPKKKWRTQAGPPVLNAVQWKQLVREIKKATLKVEICWVKGHSKDIHNKAVDKLAKISAKSATNPPLSVLEVRRKHTTGSLDIGSVEMRAQRLAIRIITSEYLKVQKVVKEAPIKSIFSELHYVTMRVCAVLF